MGIPSYGVDYEGQYDWLQIGTLTVANGVLAVTGRDNASVDDLADANKVIWRPDNGTAAALIRFRVGAVASDGDTNVIEVYAAKGADYYTRIGTLTTAVGAQDWSSGHFIDEIAITNEKWSHGIRVENVTDEIGRVYLNTGGFDRFLFVASTLATPCTLYIDIVRLDKQIPLEAEILSAIVNITGGPLVTVDLSDVVSTISNMHTDLENQNSSILTSLDTLEDAISDGISNIVDQNSSMLTDLTGLANQNSSLLTSLDVLEDAISDGISDLVDQNSSIMTDIGTLETAVSAGISDLVDQLSSLMTDTEAVDAAVDLVTVEVSDAASQLKSVLKETLDFSNATSAYNVVEEVSGIHSQAVLNVAAVAAVEGEVKSAADSIISTLVLHEAGVRSGIRSVMTDNETAMRSGVTSALSNVVSELIVNDDLIEVGIRSGVKSALVVNEAGIRSGVESALSTLIATTNTTVNLATAAIEDDVESVHSIIKRTQMSATNSDLWIEDIASATDGTRLEVSNAISNLKDAVDLTTTEVSDAASGISAQNSSIMTAIQAADATLTIMAMDSAQSGMFSTLEDDVELVQSAVDSVHSVLLAGTTVVSSGGGTEKITIPADPFQVAGAAQACREVIIYCPSGNVGITYLQIGAVADADDLPLHEDVWLSIPINNTNLLNFFGTAADKVYLLWRN